MDSLGKNGFIFKLTNLSYNTVQQASAVLAVMTFIPSFFSQNSISEF